MATERKAAIVTGAASGLGRAMALGLAESGTDVVAVDRNTATLAMLAPAASGAGSVLPVPADLAQPESFDRIVAAAPEGLRRIDVRPDAGGGLGAIRRERRSRNQCRQRPGVGARRSAAQSDPLLGSHPRAVEP